MPKPRSLKPITVRSAVVTCSKCGTQVTKGSQYVKIGGFDKGVGYKIIRCMLCGFTPEEVASSSPFRTQMLRLEQSIDTAVDQLESSQDWQAFVETMMPVVKELYEVSTDHLDRYDKSPCQKLHRRVLSRGQQTKEVADHLSQLIAWKDDGRLSLADVIERAPSDLIGIT